MAFMMPVPHIFLLGAYLADKAYLFHPSLVHPSLCGQSFITDSSDSGDVDN